MYAAEGRLFHEEHEVGGCENRGNVSRESARRRRAQDQLFLRRLYSRLGPLAGLAAAVSAWRDVRTAAPGKRAAALEDYLAAWLGLAAKVPVRMTLIPSG